MGRCSMAAASFWIVMFALANAEAFKFPFFMDAKDAVSSNDYDYIVVGGGVSGCPLSTTLSEKYKVLVLERGPSPYENPFVMREEHFLSGLMDPRVTQLFNSTEGVQNARARVLGGGSTINAGFYDRATYEELESLGVKFAKAFDAYDWIEGGIVHKPILGPLEKGFRDGLLESNVLPDLGTTYSHYVGTKVGGVLFDNNGTRQPASNLFKFANETNIQVMLNAVVSRILFSNDTTPKAIGVEYLDSNGVVHQAFLSNNIQSEVIISASAIGSPQLLMLSGIGPKKHLEEMGVNVVVDSPMVGQHIADNPATRINVVSPTTIELSLVKVAGITRFGSYLEALSAMEGQQFSVLFQKVTGPRSTGEVKLITKDIHDNPSITFNYFKDGHDLRTCIGGVETLERVILSESFRPFRLSTQELPSGGTVSKPARYNDLILDSYHKLEKFCKDNIGTMWHYHGSCRVGKVVDAKFRVMGVKNLRVIDGSVFDFAPGTNPQATFMMMGRYKGLEIMEERNHH